MGQLIDLAPVGVTTHKSKYYEKKFQIRPTDKI